MDDSTLEAIRAAETAAQASVCVVPPGDRPEALTEALERRVEVNAAQHVDGQPIRRVGSGDEEVLRLEHPWRVRTLANPDEEPTPAALEAAPEAPAAKPRRVKKTAANKAAANTEGN